MDVFTGASTIYHGINHLGGLLLFPFLPFDDVFLDQIFAACLWLLFDPITDQNLAFLVGIDLVKLLVFTQNCLFWLYARYFYFWLFLESFHQLFERFELFFYVFQLFFIWSPDEFSV